MLCDLYSEGAFSSKSERLFELAIRKSQRCEESLLQIGKGGKRQGKEKSETKSKKTKTGEKQCALIRGKGKHENGNQVDKGESETRERTWGERMAETCGDQVGESRQLDPDIVQTVGTRLI